MTPFVAAALVAAVSLCSSGSAQAAVDLSAHSKLAALLVPFVPNAGQWDGHAAFAAHLAAGVLFVSAEGRLVYRLAGVERTAPDNPAPGPARHRPAGPDRRAGAAPERGPGWVLTETLVDGRGLALAASPRGDRPLAGTVSYAIGNDETKHRDGLPTFERVNLGEVYTGIAVQLRVTGNNVEKIFTVAPARDPRVIRIRLAGAEGLALGGNGELIAHTGNGPVVFTAPIAYQEDGAGHRSAVPVRYALDSATASYGFAVGAYDTDRPLVIDPLLQSTYLGGTGGDQALALAVHPATGEVYVAGYTSSTAFPKVAGAEQATHAADSGNYDAFVTRLDATLTTRLQSTYLGGAGFDAASALAIHPATGEVYVTGTTTSTDFPKVAGAEQTANGGGNDAFITRLDAALTTRLQSTYLGGAGYDGADALAIHPATGEVYVAGFTNSTDLPKVAGAEQTANGGGYDAFVTRLDPALTTRLQSTYLGGSGGTDHAVALAIHPATGAVYVAGWTNSTDFPKVAGAEQATHAADGGTYDAFVSLLGAALTTWPQSSYLGGTGSDSAAALAIHPATGEVYVAGYTDSSDFPKVAGAEQTANGGSGDAFVTRLDAALTTRLQSTYLGGTGADQANALAIHPATGEVYVAGYTNSTDFPKVAGAEQTANGGGYDGFVSRLDAALITRLQSTYLGGIGFDLVTKLAIHPATGVVYVAGATVSTDFPKVAGAEQVAIGGGSDGFVSRYTLVLMDGTSVPAAFAFAPRTGVAPGSLQTSAPATISGMAASPQPIGIVGGNLAQFCISAAADCGCGVRAFGSAAATIADGQSVCVRQYAPGIAPASATTTVLVGGGSAPFFVSTGAGACELDIDGNGALDALTDGLMLLRAMFGLTGTSVTNAAVGDGATRSTWAQLQPYLNGNCGTTFAP